MSLLGLLNQTITIYPKSGYSDDGRETLGSGVSVKSRFQTVTKRTLRDSKATDKTSVIEVHAIAYVPAGTDVEEDYKVTYSSVNYKVVTKYAVPGATGATDHIRIELQKWQSV